MCEISKMIENQKNKYVKMLCCLSLWYKSRVQISILVEFGVMKSSGMVKSKIHMIEFSKFLSYLVCTARERLISNLVNFGQLVSDI